MESRAAGIIPGGPYFLLESEKKTGSAFGST
jgi:hypothetical protein